MQIFEQYVSNTCAGSGNQLFFDMPADQTRTGRVFYRMTAGGCFSYALLFSNIIDSTYADGRVSHRNLILPPWTITQARAGRCAFIPPEKPLDQLMMCDAPDAPSDIRVESWQVLTFDGESEKHVEPGAFFSTDPFTLCLEAGEYLCVELTYSGKRLPYHEESLLPIFTYISGAWCYDRRMPLPGLVACRRPVKARIGFLGDSITQGIGVASNSYLHWNARLAALLGNDYAYWNLGIGYGRASDAATDGAWLYKAKHNDWIVVCYGVNDIQQGASAQEIERDLATIVRALRQAGVRVVMQTVPPFDYTGERIRTFEEVNAFIRGELAREVELVFDVVPLLARDSAHPYAARFGGHPNEAGCALWAQSLCDALRPLLGAR